MMLTESVSIQQLQDENMIRTIGNITQINIPIDDNISTWKNENELSDEDYQIINLYFKNNYRN